MTYTYTYRLEHRIQSHHLTYIQLTQYRAIRDTSVEDREQENNTSARKHS